ncbi:hypothetical protein HMPREF2768_00025 [Propionibacterium sp. HMSC068C01]|jgi:hypothetical protein|nr:class F sortase [Cutibacterium acnes]OFL47343.1 hypothetical protein HMPREF2768_00025 [Propionibacterium sp. HMSC068C01]MCM4179315.1 peptidase C60, sortase A and B [Cutibacterium acnes P15]MCP9415316.1 class F sortase [Cutibacterium acnes]MCP9431346.1 class F sortase [Cutibacterium acnes]WOT09310.1 class F sortase [Cutibacterium acnes subsp. defendens]
MRRVIGLVACLVTAVVGSVLVWHGIDAGRTPQGWSRDSHGALVIPAPQTGHNPHPSPIGPVASPTPHQAGARVIVPAVGIDAPITGRLSQRTDGSWYPPAHGVARASQSAPLSAPSGTTMLAGHVWVVGDPGVFFRLREVHLGNEVAVTDQGRVQRYRVTDITVTPKMKLPQWAWGTLSGPRRVILITCGGHETVRDGHRMWDSNVIVTATRIK